VNDNKLLADLVEHPDRCSATADDGATAALGRHRATEDELGTVEVSPGVAHPVGHCSGRVDLPVPLHYRLAAPRPDGCGVGPLAKQEAERGHDHGLARAGLAGERGKPGAERQSRFADDPQVANGDLFDHERGPSEVSGPRHP
jgi:hypothetical protein